MKIERFRGGARIVACLALLLFVATLASADPIGPGFDFFHTPPGGAAVDLGSGPIPLEGVPLPNFAMGLTDTIVARMDPGPPEGGTGLIDIELVALHLKSVAPIDIDPSPSGVLLADLHATVDASDRFFTGASPRPAGNGTGPSLFDLPTLPSPPSIGLMEMMHGGPGPHTGATMRACFGDPAGCDPTVLGAGLGQPGGGIHASIFLVVPGGDPADPMDVLAMMPAPPITLASEGTYLHTPLFPAHLGGIILGAIVHVGPHPNAIPSPPGDIPTPEPASCVLMLAACTALSLCRRAR